MDVLEGVASLWQDVGNMLNLPYTMLNVIESESVSDVERLRAVLRYWLQHDPHASWRMLIWSLDNVDKDWNRAADLKRVTDGIRIYAEPLTGQYYRNKFGLFYGCAISICNHMLMSAIVHCLYHCVLIMCNWKNSSQEVSYVGSFRGFLETPFQLLVHTNNGHFFVACKRRSDTGKLMCYAIDRGLNRILEPPLR